MEMFSGRLTNSGGTKTIKIKTKQNKTKQRLSQKKNRIKQVKAICNKSGHDNRKQKENVRNQIVFSQLRVQLGIEQSIIDAQALVNQTRQLN